LLEGTIIDKFSFSRVFILTGTTKDALREKNFIVDKRTRSRREFLKPCLSRQDEVTLRMLRLGRPAMGTRFEIALTSRDREYIRHAHGVLNEVGRLEAILSVFRKESSLCRMNEIADRKWFKPDTDLWNILVTSLELCQKTGGALDITSGALWKLWGFFQKSGRIPSALEIEKTLEKGGFLNVRIREETREVKYLKPGLEINLGGTGKGYALDRVVGMLENKQLENFLLNAGHSTFYAGGSLVPGEKEWKIGIRNPRETGNADFAVVRLKDQALATSGTGVQFFNHEGSRLGHIIDPRSGKPAGHFLSATAIAENAVTADALSTAFFVMDVQGVQAFCKNNSGVGALLITRHESGREPGYYIFGKAEESVEIA
jgi:FAD:protein FMN transferase